LADIRIENPEDEKRGNAIVQALEEKLNSPSDLVKEHIEWALSRYTSN